MRNPHRKPQRPENGRPQGRSRLFKKRLYNLDQAYGRPFVSKLWHDIRAVFSRVYLQSFLLHDIRAFVCHLYVRFIPKYMTIFLQTHIYMRTKNPIYMRYKQACGIWGYRKSSHKRHRIIPSAKNPFMYDGAEKWRQFQSSMAVMAALISSKIWFLFIGLTVVVIVGSPTTDLLESVDLSLERLCTLFHKCWPKQRSIQLEN